MATTNITPQPSVKVPWVDEGGRIVLVWLNWLRSQLGQILQPTNLGPTPSPSSPGVTGTLQPVNGGLGTTAIPTNGEIPIGDTATGLYVPATLTAGVGVSVTNGAGSITIAAISGILRVATVLNNATLIALPSGLITVVPAPNAGLRVIPIYAELAVNLTAGYTNIDPAAWMQFTDPSGDAVFSYIPNDAAIVNGSTTLLTDLLGSAGQRTARLVPWVATEGVDGWGPIPIIYAEANQNAAPVRVFLSNNGAGNLTGGDPANVGTFTALYAIFP